MLSSLPSEYLPSVASALKLNSLHATSQNKMGILCPASANASTAVAIWTPDRIIVAADSKKTGLDGSPALPECKIKSDGPLHFVTAGLFEFSVTGFYVPQIIHSSLVRFGTFENRSFDTLVLFITGNIALALEDAKQSVRGPLGRNPNLSISEIIMAESDGGVLVAKYYQIDISGSFPPDRIDSKQERNCFF